MLNNKLTISVIIPAYNEELKIKQCLESLLRQNHPIDEIIVICNGCDDKTYDIARSYKTINVIEIEKRSLINARDIGFNMATGDIIAKINADVICLPNWSERIIEDFSDNNVSAVAGLARTWTMVFMPNFLTTFWSRVYINNMEAFFGAPILWGSNLAMRKDAWLKINKMTCKIDSEVHEDQDLSIHLNLLGLKIIKDTKLIVINDEESYFNWSKLIRYLNVTSKTKNKHTLELSKSLVRIKIFQRFLKLFISLLPGFFFICVSFIMAFINWLWNRLFYKHH